MDYSHLANISMEGGVLEEAAARAILESPDVLLLPLLTAAFEVRRKFTGMTVKVHVINNGQNGYCPEDCHYCAQSKSSQAAIQEYPLKSDREFLAEAGAAYTKGAHRYCMVFAGRGPSAARVEHLAGLIRAIKSRYPIQVCVSAGLMDEAKARVLKDAGLDRLNHNLNASERFYSKICTTHSYADRLKTLRAARQAGLAVCSGVIIGLGEQPEDVVALARALRSLEAESIPVNFFIPIDGVAASRPVLTPEYCLRVLCLYRLLNPKAEIRVAAGRELYLRSLEPLALYPANSLFFDGYLNVRGANRSRTLQMIKDAGFSVDSEFTVDELIENERGAVGDALDPGHDAVMLKDAGELRSQLKI